MTPAPLNTDVITARLRLIAESLEQLGELRDVTPERLREEPLTRAAAERLLQVVVDLAVDVNSHVVVSRLGRAPQTGRESFLDAATAGALDTQLADRLAPAAGLRNVLVHRYVDIRVDLVANAIEQALDEFPTFVEQIAAFIRDSTG